ncbi:MAG: hypothetical protein ACYCWB_15305 [Thiobacillus sp.]
MYSRSLIRDALGFRHPPPGPHRRQRQRRIGMVARFIRTRNHKSRRSATGATIV